MSEKINDMLEGQKKLYTSYRTRFVGVGRMKVGDELFCMFEFGGGKA